HSRRLLLSIAAAAALPRDVDVRRYRSHRVLRLCRRADVAVDAEDGELPDDDRRSADEHRVRRMYGRLRVFGDSIGPGRAGALATRSQRARAALAMTLRMSIRVCVSFAE